jgi:hypothetical protein
MPARPLPGCPDLRGQFVQADRDQHRALRPAASLRLRCVAEPVERAADPVGKLYYPVIPVAEPDLADQLRMTRLLDDQCRAVKAATVPPAGQPIADQCRTGVQAGTGERNPGPVEAAFFGRVRMQRLGVR